MLKKDKFEIPNDMGVGTMAWGDEKAGFVSDPTQKPKEGEFNPADLQVGARASSRLFDLHLGSANNTKATNPNDPPKGEGPLERLFPQSSFSGVRRMPYACFPFFAVPLAGGVQHPGERRDHVLRHVRRVWIQVL